MTEVKILKTISALNAGMLRLHINREQATTVDEQIALTAIINFSIATKLEYKQALKKIQSL